MIKYFTSESVTEGHPDKVCDIVSDSVLDAILSQDPDARVACETVANENFLMVMGEITTSARIDAESIARSAVLGIGYDKDEYGFNGKTMTFKTGLKKQSAD
ncbi:MAG: methionine adenosyltransferase, partial [Clostridia bacterium]|nr:methionine adenosyltransferase [Clostridia bacterium]